jgi:hypothetical protein
MTPEELNTLVGADDGDAEGQLGAVEVTNDQNGDDGGDELPPLVPSCYLEEGPPGANLLLDPQAANPGRAPVEPAAVHTEGADMAVGTIPVLVEEGGIAPSFAINDGPNELPQEGQPQGRGNDTDLASPLCAPNDGHESEGVASSTSDDDIPLSMRFKQRKPTALNVITMGDCIVDLVDDPPVQLPTTTPPIMPPRGNSNKEGARHMADGDAGANGIHDEAHEIVSNICSNETVVPLGLPRPQGATTGEAPPPARRSARDIPRGGASSDSDDDIPLTQRSKVLAKKWVETNKINKKLDKNVDDYIARVLSLLRGGEDDRRLLRSRKEAASAQKANNLNAIDVATQARIYYSNVTKIRERRPTTILKHMRYGALGMYYLCFWTDVGYAGQDTEEWKPIDYAMQFPGLVEDYRKVMQHPHVSSVTIFIYTAHLPSPGL